ncbi:tyrosine-protein phosphatase [Kitasatospora sp. NPDC049258]|uniref:tyrosine-protein phosphatase n=1 Tax=Kitasatospora sp. NPDC049258 TaxID=3155394 RepID=UPI0034463937
MTERHLAFERLHNFRDLGGYRTADGRAVRWRLLYRSDSLGKLAGEDLGRFRALGVRTVIDLRYPWEIERSGRVPDLPGLGYHNLSIEHRPYDQAALGPEIETVSFLAGKFAEVAQDGTAELAEVIRTIAAADAPLAFHCAAGKDRTGIVAALVLGLLGVDEDQIAADFALTGLATDRFVADWHARNPGRTLGWPGYGTAPAELIRRFLADLGKEYGSPAAYVRDRLGVDAPTVDALRSRLLAP